MKRIAGIPLIILGNVISQIINFFKNRVSADGGVFEAESCLEAEVVRLRNLGLYDKASLILTPNAYKSSKIYSLVPNNGSGDFSFTRASVRRRFNLSGVFESLSNNLPALEFPVGGGCPSWSPLPQRTNLDPISATFAAYIPDNSGGVSFANVTASNPFNYNQVAKVIPLSVNGQHRPFNTFNLTSAGRMYCIAKADGYNFLSMGQSGGLSGSSTIFDLSTGTIATNAGYNPIIKTLGNGWYWCEIDCDAGNFSRWFIVRNANNTADYIGDGTSGILFCHKQLEVGAFGTSPIVTTGATATRIGDISSLVRNQTTDTTIYAELFLQAGSLADNSTYTIFDVRTSISNRISLYRFNNGINIDVVNTSVQPVSLLYTIPTLVQGQRYKIALRLTATQLFLFVNGALVFTSSTISMPNLSSGATFNYGNFNQSGLQWGGNLGPLSIYDLALINSECIALTT